MTQPGPGHDPRPQAGGGASTARLWPRTHPKHVTAHHAVVRPRPGPRHAAPHEPDPWSMTASRAEHDVVDGVGRGRHVAADDVPPTSAADPAPATWTPQQWQPPAANESGYFDATMPSQGYAPAP